MYKSATVLLSLSIMKINMRLKTCRLFVAFEIILRISATTHWIVTENGRIQPMSDSIFQMRRPYDLFSFMEQGKRRDAVNALFKSMRSRKIIIDNQFIGLHSASDIENRLHKTDIDCLLREQYNLKLDFHHSIVTDGGFRDGITKKDFDLDNIPNDELKRVPDCEATFPLDFSMHTFEHLNAMRNRKKLIQQQEKSLMKFIPANMDLSILGNKVAYGLIRNNTSWLHLNLASIYWRIKGDPYNALECARRAIVAAPKQHRDIPLLNTGGIFHAANQSKEAAIVLHTAIEYAPMESLHHLTLANVYAYLGEYNKSIEYYDNSLKLNPGLDISRSAKHNILCNLKLESSLSALHQQLLDILNELRAYHSEQTELLGFQEKILLEDIKQMPFLTSEDEIENNNLNLHLTKGGQSFMQSSKDESILSCDIMSERQILAQKLQIDFSVSLQVLKNIENQAREIRERMPKSKIGNEPTAQPKYPNLEIKKTAESFKNIDWPMQSYCESLIPFVIDIKQYIPVYLPPENAGYV